MASPGEKYVSLERSLGASRWSQPSRETSSDEYGARALTLAASLVGSFAASNCLIAGRSLVVRI